MEAGSGVEVDEKEDEMSESGADIIGCGPTPPNTEQLASNENAQLVSNSAFVQGRGNCLQRPKGSRERTTEKVRNGKRPWREPLENALKPNRNRLARLTSRGGKATISSRAMRGS